MKKIILDTNFSLIPFQFKVDIYEEFNRIINEDYQLFFPRIALPELLKLKFGSAGLKLMQKKDVEIIDIPLIENVDNSIIEYAKKENAIVATQDKEIKRNSKKAGLKVITLRQKSYLDLM